MSPQADAPVDSAWVYAQLLKIHPPAASAPLCVAFSGGADSTALLGLLAAVPAAASRLRALHLDHGLQARSASWSRICRATCRALSIPLSTRRLRIVPRRGESLEALARSARYAALAAALHPGEVLLSAHHLEDQLETVLLQLLRGAGLPGLSAMPSVMPLGTGHLVRPLLELPRERLRGWVQQSALRWVEDPSNADETFDRNYLRRQVVPLLQRRWPAAARTVSRSARNLAQAQRLLDALAAADAGRAADGAALSVAALRALPLERRRNALRWWLGAAGLPAPDARRLEEIAVTLLAARAGANPLVTWGTHQVRRHAGQLVLNEPQAVAPYEIRWNIKRHSDLTLPAGAGRLQLARAAGGPLDAAALPAQVTVRSRRGGERLRPRAGGPSRSLKSLLQGAAIPLIERENLPLLFAGEELLAVADLWVDARCQADEKTAKRLRLIWHRPP